MRSPALAFASQRRQTSASTTSAASTRPASAARVRVQAQRHRGSAGWLPGQRWSGVRHVRLKHLSREFCELLALLDEQTPVANIHLILDRSARTGLRMVSWLDAHPQRTFVFTSCPVHASWLSLSKSVFDLESQMSSPSGLRDATIATEQIEDSWPLTTRTWSPLRMKEGVRFYKRLKTRSPPVRSFRWPHD